MRLSEFLEAWVQLVFAGEGNRVVPGENSIPFRIDFRNRASPS
jgi:hypothetical protein